ncbi:hypothetical protein [Kitasatospora sp. NPDC085464]|uniref:hypothetical protein n=1 Tax=Kitasatospora sp. NPDC085464 TaxID=3364063 RepID=UPI0037C6CFD1
MSARVAEGTVVSLDQVLWEMWKSSDLPEGYRVEIIEENLTVSPTGGSRHFTVNRAVLGEGPAKGFVIGPGITGERRG